MITVSVIAKLAKGSFMKSVTEKSKKERVGLVNVVLKKYYIIVSYIRTKIIVIDIEPKVSSCKPFLIAITIPIKKSIALYNIKLVFPFVIEVGGQKV